VRPERDDARPNAEEKPAVLKVVFEDGAQVVEVLADERTQFFRRGGS
jgi:hypothetical protein